MLLFTQDNATAFEISRRFLLPIITHETRVRERSEILAGLADGSYGAVVTSKVLNEASTSRRRASRSSCRAARPVREHVQRLGRVLRAQPASARCSTSWSPRDDRDLHQRETAGPQCLPLIWSACVAAATSCGWCLWTTGGARTSRRWPRRWRAWRASTSARRATRWTTRSTAPRAPPRAAAVAAATSG
jgi:hypothetical protein